jgi:hypothetical protein
MSVYTHNTPDNHDPYTFIKMIVTDEPLADLNLSDDWFEICPQEVADIELMTGRDFVETEGPAHVRTEFSNAGNKISKYGRL